MTDAMINLQGLPEKSSDCDLLREMIGFAAQRLMELEVEGLTGAGVTACPGPDPIGAKVRGLRSGIDCDSGSLSGWANLRNNITYRPHLLSSS
jgi:hypothetical protein